MESRRERSEALCTVRPLLLLPHKLSVSVLPRSLSDTSVSIDVGSPCRPYSSSCPSQRQRLRACVGAGGSGERGHEASKRETAPSRVSCLLVRYGWLASTPATLHDSVKVHPVLELHDRRVRTAVVHEHMHSRLVWHLHIDCQHEHERVNSWQLPKMSGCSSRCPSKLRRRSSLTMPCDLLRHLLNSVSNSEIYIA